MDCWQLLGSAAGKSSKSDAGPFVTLTDLLTFYLLQELHVLHEGVHVPHGGGEWHRPLLQLQNEVLWEGGAEQKQRHHLPRHWGLCTARNGAWDRVVQGMVRVFHQLSLYQQRIRVVFWLNLALNTTFSSGQTKREKYCLLCGELGGPQWNRPGRPSVSNRPLCQSS